MRVGHLSRSLAAGVDLALVVGLGVLLAPGPLGSYFSARAVVLLRIGEPDTWFVGPAAMLIGIFGEFVFLMPLAAMIALAPEGLLGASVGKLVLRLRIEAFDGGSRRARLLARYLLKTAPLSGTVVALVSGLWAVELVAVAVALAITGQWIVASLRGRPVAHDRLTATFISRRSGG